MTFEVMSSLKQLETIGSVAILITATLPDMNYRLWKIVSADRYILNMQLLLKCWKVHNGKIEILSFGIKFHCQLVLTINFLVTKISDNKKKSLKIPKG